MDLRGLVQYIPKVDKTLTMDGECADAKATGDKINETNKTLSETNELLKALDKNVKDMDAKNVSFKNAETWTDKTTVEGAVKDVLKQTEVYEASGYMANHWSGENNYLVVGKICILSFNIQNGLSPAPSNSVFVTDLPKPKNTVRFNAWHYDNDYAFDVMPCGITTDGHLSILKELAYQHSFAGTVAYQIA
jgi:hypothetical protein